MWTVSGGLDHGNIPPNCPNCELGKTRVATPTNASIPRTRIVHRTSPTEPGQDLGGRLPVGGAFRVEGLRTAPTGCSPARVHQELGPRSSPGLVRHSMRLSIRRTAPSAGNVRAPVTRAVTGTVPVCARRDTTTLWWAGESAARTVQQLSRANVLAASRDNRTFPDVITARKARCDNADAQRVSLSDCHGIRSRPELRMGRLGFKVTPSSGAIVGTVHRGRLDSQGPNPCTVDRTH